MAIRSILPDYPFVTDRELKEAIEKALIAGSCRDSICATGTNSPLKADERARIAAELETIVMRFAADSQDRITRLRLGDWRFGCSGMHAGNGTPGCPRNEPHHHHGKFCPLPSERELKAAGVDPKKFKEQTGHA